MKLIERYILIILLLFTFQQTISAENKSGDNDISKKSTILMNDKKYNEAKDLFDKLIESNPHNAMNYYNRGICYSKLKYYPEAINDYEKALTFDIDDSFKIDILLKLGSTYLKENKINQAMGSWYKVLKLNFSNKKAREHISDAVYEITKTDSEKAKEYIKSGIKYFDGCDYKAAIEEYLKALKEDPSYLGAKYELGMAYLENGEIDIAHVLFLEIMEKAPYLSNVYLELGNLYFVKKEYGQAEEMFEKSLELTLDDANKPYINVRNNLVDIYLKKNDYKNAVLHLERLHELLPDSVKIRNSLGINYINSSEYKKAENLFLNILSKEPNHVFANGELGIVYALTGKHRESVEIYEKLITIVPDNSIIYMNLGNSYQELKNYEKAINTYKKSIELDPNNFLAYYNLARIHFSLKNYDASLTELKNAAKINPNDSKTYYQMARIYSLQNNEKEAIINLEMAIALDEKCMEEIKNNKDFDNLKNNKRFHDLIKH